VLIVWYGWPCYHLHYNCYHHLRKKLAFQSTQLSSLAKPELRWESVFKWPPKLWWRCHSKWNKHVCIPRLKYVLKLTWFFLTHEVPKFCCKTSFCILHN
jgi:hypothetical protein